MSAAAVAPPSPAIHSQPNASLYSQPQPPSASEIHTVGPFILGKTLGTGATGKVKLGFHKETGFKVAVKIISKDMLTTRPSMRKKVEREIVVMKIVDHPSVLRLYDVYETSKYLFLILEYVEGGELFDYLITKGLLEPPEALYFFQQLIRGLDHCHSHIICHRDLKPENLLLDADRNIKIADFGMAALMQKGQLLGTSCGSPHYASPEVVMGLKYAGTSADIWSCGVILYALLTGKLPFDDDNIRKLLSKVKAGMFSMPQFLHKDAQDLITRMLTVDPAKRITITEIKLHPWFNSDRPVLNKQQSLNNLLPNDRARLSRDVLDELPSDPLQDLSEIDDDIFRSLKALGWGTDQEIQEALLSEIPNTIAVFYHLLEARKRNPEFNINVQAQAAAKVPRALVRARSSGDNRRRSLSSTDGNPLPPTPTPPSPLRERRDRGNTTGTKNQGIVHLGPLVNVPPSVSLSSSGDGLMFSISPSTTPAPDSLGALSLSGSSGELLPPPPISTHSPSTTPPSSPRNSSPRPQSVPWRAPASPLSSSQSTSPSPSPPASPVMGRLEKAGSTSPININRFRRIKLATEASSPAGTPIIGSSPKRSWFSNFFSGSPKPTRQAFTIHSRKSGQALTDELQRTLDSMRVLWREQEPSTYKAQFLTPEGSFIKFSIEVMDGSRGPMGLPMLDGSNAFQKGYTIININHRGGSAEQFAALCARLEDECDL